MNEVNSWFTDLAKSNEDMVYAKITEEHEKDPFKKRIAEEFNENTHTPSPERLQEIKNYYELYLKKNPKATTRNAKRATIRHFNLIIKK